ncbi:MAG TPA: hypothetical protein VGH37_05930 [Candidatus Acidoferrum sp.]|jgi:hypothetical protein
MKRLFLLLLLSTGASFAQSPFDGTWIIQSDPSQLPQKPVEYVLANGMFRCSGCIANVEIKSDGRDYKIEETSYWDTASARIVDSHSVEVTVKKSGKTMFTEIDTVSADGNTLTQSLKDTTEAQTVTAEILFRRVNKGSASDHPISGSWRAYKMNRSKNGSVIRYTCTADGFSAETPLGEKFDAKFDGKDYPIEDDPGHSVVSVKRVSPNEIEITTRRNEKVVGVLHLTASFDGNSIRVVYESKESDTTKSYEMLRQH